MEPLSAGELRVLGCLVEKEATTPDQYPLTANALLLACNQSSNRNPVVHYEPAELAAILAGLRQRGLARVVLSPSNRADKYRHVLHEAWGLTPAELAVLAVLALRGPQTVSELRSRTERYPSLDDLGGVEGVLHRLANRYAEPYVARLPRQDGQREERWGHLLAGEVQQELPPPPPRAGTAERVSALEARVEALGAEVAALRDQLGELRGLLG